MEEIRADKVCLRPAVEGDSRMIYEWSHYSDVAHFLYPDKKDDDVWWAEWCADWVSHYFDGSAQRQGRMFVIMKHGEPIGCIAYNPVDEAQNQVEIDMWMSCEANCNQGYGPDALKALCRYIHQTLGVVKYWIQPSAKNPRAIRSYEKAGFKRIDITREKAEAQYGRLDSPDFVVLVKNMLEN